MKETVITLVVIACFIALTATLDPSANFKANVYRKELEAQHEQVLALSAEVARLRSKYEPPAPEPVPLEQQPADCQEW